MQRSSHSTRGASSYSSSSRHNEHDTRSSSGNNDYSGSSRYSGSSNGASNDYSRRNGTGGRDKYTFDEVDLSNGGRKPTSWSNATDSFEKMFYTESPIVTNRPQHEISSFYKEYNVVTSGKVMRPVLEFNDMNIPKPLLNKMYDMNYDKPTSIQSMCWPTLLSGLNMVGIAQTGSGKTLGFIFPMLVHIMNNQRYVRSQGREAKPGPIGLVLAPTRELAIQIQQVADQFGSQVGIKNAAIYGGASKGPQMGQMRRGVEIVIATPGRLIDFLKEGQITLSKCTYLVLDEADRMLDMGFEPQIRKIIEQIRPDRQTAMFSATWPKEVRKLAEDFISSYTHISIGTTNLTANPNIRQIVEVCEEFQKENRLREVLGEIMVNRDSKVIVFAETKKKVDMISRFIKNLGYYCLTIHGDKKQMEREWVLNEFKQKPRCILCATDVAARGLNIEDIKYVINVDYPMQTEDYVHRIGRTARNSNTGTSYTFLTRDNSRHVSKLIDVLRETNQFISDDVLNLARPMQSRNFRNGGASRYPTSDYGSQNNNNIGMNMRPRKRDASEMSNDYGNGSNGASSRYGATSNGGSYTNGGDNSDNKRMRRNRWDDAASEPKMNGSQNNRYQNGTGNSNGTSNGTHNGYSNGSVSNGSSATNSNGYPPIYGGDLMSQLSMAPPPPPPLPVGPSSLMGSAKPPASFAGPMPPPNYQPYPSYY